MKKQSVEEKEQAAMEQAAFVAFNEWRLYEKLRYMDLAKMINAAAARAVRAVRERKVS